MFLKFGSEHEKLPTSVSLILKL